jgi:hypothetical protein
VFVHTAFVHLGISLDGFVAGVNRGPHNPVGHMGMKVHEWMFHTRAFRQYLNAGLIDELSLALSPILLGEGLRLFDGIGSEPIALERVTVFESGQRTTIRFRVVR